MYTGNTPLRARAKLTLAGIDPDALLNGLDEGISYCLGYERDRFSAVERVFRDHPDEPIVVVGDAPLDLMLAERLRARFWHVGEGFDRDNPALIGESSDFAGSVLDDFIWKLEVSSIENG